MHASNRSSVANSGARSRERERERERREYGPPPLLPVHEPPAAMPRTVSGSRLTRVRTSRAVDSPRHHLHSRCAPCPSTATKERVLGDVQRALERCRARRSRRISAFGRAARTYTSFQRLLGRDRVRRAVDEAHAPWYLGKRSEAEILLRRAHTPLGRPRWCCSSASRSGRDAIHGKAR